jgi:hypothetical protein
MHNLKISGYVQAQFMNAQADGLPNFSGGKFTAKSHDIFELRRGRFRADYHAGIADYCFQLEATEGGIVLKDLYAKVSEPYLKMFSLTGGIFKVQMSQELLYGADQRYCMEASRLVQTFFPGEYDLGAMLTVKAPPSVKVLNPLSLTLTMINGTAAKPENDNKKNITARLLYDKTFKERGKDKFRLLVGAATYQGGIYQGHSDVYSMDGNKFVLNNDPANIGQQGDRNYYAGELTLQYTSPIGKTSLNGEF